MISERKSSRPAPLSRKTTPQFITKTPSTGRSEHRRERDDEERGRDSGESFPQFCMTCEKQFLPANNTFLYCSETCRLHDQSAPTRSSTSASYTSSSSHFPAQSSPPLTPYSRQFASSYTNTYTTPSHEEGPDIIPRFSPTQSRPRSYFNSDPYPSHTSAYTTLSASPHHTHSSSALESLRELATALPKTSSSSSRRERHLRGRDPESPPKSSASSISRTGSGVWDYIPFTSSGSKTSTPTPSATPGNSYTSYNQYNVSQSYGGNNGYPGIKSQDPYTYAAGSAKVGAGYTSTGGMGMDRPLPPRSGPGGYGHRPRSIDLVTPFSGH